MEESKRFLGRHLMVKGEYVDKILSGQKRATIRLGHVRLKYNELIVHGGGRPVAKVRVERIHYKRVSELTEEDAQKDGFASVNELINALEKAYGTKLRPDDIVTIIEFSVIQDLSRLEPQDPYLGLQPADVARLALRYIADRLSDDERKILRDLTMTNSIRATAYRLFGDISKRWRVRRILRKALRELVAGGYIKTRKAGHETKRRRRTPGARHTEGVTS